ncbi:MAG TPA: transposase [Thermoanaerobaculia bacterium]|jgi:putative transposase
MDWPHAPVHRFGEAGVYFITAGTSYKQHFFRTREALDDLRDSLFTQAAAHDCTLQAWALLSNHYHLVVSCKVGDQLRLMLRRLHIDSAIDANRRDGAKGRRVWFQYRDTQLTNEGSWLARLRYTHENAAHHGLVGHAADYPWCSAAWFARTARPSFAATVRNTKIDRVKVADDFVVECV